MFNHFVCDEIEKKISSGDVFKKIVTAHNNKMAISFVNPFSYGILAKNINLVNELDILFSDGALLCTLTNLRRDKKIDRVSFDFSSIAGQVFEFSSQEKLSVALVGASPDEIGATVKYLNNRYPNLDICYSRDGYFTKEQFQNVIQELDNKKANILISGMGTPLQEEFIVYAKKHSKEVTLAFTCGGFLTQTSLKGDYYHPIVKKLGLRWLQRCIMHKHVRKRLIKDYPSFIIRYLINR